MVSRRVVGAVVLVGLLGIGVGYALFTGIGPAPGGDTEEPITEFPTATPNGPTPADSTGEDTATQSAPPFSFTVDDIEECGQTCRDVTATLHNNQDRTATDVTVYTRIYAGRDTTADDDRIWENQREIGDLEAGGTHTSTERVELTLQEGFRIEQNDGWITIQTTVESAETTVTFTDTEQVA